MIQLTAGSVPALMSLTKSLGYSGRKAFWYSVDEGFWYWLK